MSRKCLKSVTESYSTDTTYRQFWHHTWIRNGIKISTRLNMNDLTHYERLRSLGLIVESPIFRVTTFVKREVTQRDETVRNADTLRPLTAPIMTSQSKKIIIVLKAPSHHLTDFVKNFTETNRHHELRTITSQAEKSNLH